MKSSREEVSRSFLDYLSFTNGRSFFGLASYHLITIFLLVGVAVFSLFLVFKPQQEEAKEIKPSSSLVKEVKTEIRTDGISMRDLQLEDTKQKRELEIESLEDQLARLKEEESKNNQELESLRK